MTGDTHYDLEVLAELAEGLLDDATVRRVREHLALCEPCGEKLADLAAVREVLAAVPVPAMPLGVALRIDQALAAEADCRVPDDVPAPGVRLGVVTPEGTVAPVPTTRTATRRARAGRRHRWSMPIAVAAAAAVVLGGAGLSATLLADGDGTPALTPVAQGSTSPSPTRTHLRTNPAYSVFASGHNYTSRELSGPLLGYFGVAPGSGTTDEDEKLDTCVKRFSNELDRPPIGVDKALYNGNEATIMAFWEDKKLNAVRVVVVDSACRSLRPEGLATWR